MNFRRIKQVCEYGWKDAQTLCQEEGAKKGKIAIFLDILHCFFKYNVWSNQYKKEKLLATDVQTITDIDDEYNKDFMAAADIVFFSHENLTNTPEATAQAMMDKYGTSVVVCGLGKDGALLAVKDDNYMERIPAIDVRPVVNTVGAGEALFACFCHLYHTLRLL